MTSNFTYRYLNITPEHTAAIKATGTPTATTYGTKSDMTFATGASSTALPYIGMGEIDDESIAYQFDLMTRSGISRYGAAKSVNGKEYSEGGINFVTQPDDFLGLCLFGIYGSGDGYTIGASNLIHSFTESSNNQLPSFTLEVGREEKEHTYTGMCINNLSISATHGEYVTSSVTFNGKSESNVDTLIAAPTFGGATLDGFHFAEGTVSFSESGSTGVSSTKIKSISMEFNMNLDTDAACSIGDRTYLRQPQPQLREITGSVEFSDASTTSATNVPGYDMLLAAAGKMYTGVAADPAIKLVLTNSTQSLAIGIRKVRWEAPSANVSGRDTQTLTLNFVALVDVTDNVMSNMVLTHTAASTALAVGVKYDTI
tara:strand:+ start:12100 stop:13212 length:1113 start_codon:yes stop_codon:yes gene_type:complete